MNIDKIAILIKKTALEFDKISNSILAEYELTASQYKVLKYLYTRPSGAARVVDLEKHYSMTHPTTLGLVDTIERKGFVTRVPNPNDARGKLVALTDKAYAKQDTLLKVGDAIEEKLTANLSTKEKNQLVALLQKLLRSSD
ncbi:MAG: MarR family transcriptional regulator [Clostridia bacterium]|nr:MarR family transcriptional regulator [Clostridia bacterium]